MVLFAEQMRLISYIESMAKVCPFIKASHCSYPWSADVDGASGAHCCFNHSVIVSFFEFSSENADGQPTRAFTIAAATTNGNNRLM